MGLFSSSDPGDLQAKGNIRGLAKLLSAKDEATRRQAAAALNEIGDARAADAFRRALHDTDEVVAGYGAKGLIRVAGAQVWPELAAAWQGLASANHRVFVGGAIAEATDPASIELLFEMANDGWRGVRTTAAEGFGRLAARGALPDQQRARTLAALCAMLGDDDAGARTAAAEALGDLGDAAAFDQLTAAAEQRSESGADAAAARAARAALARLGPLSGEYLARLMTNAATRVTAVNLLRMTPLPDDPHAGPWQWAVTGDWEGHDPRAPAAQAAIATLLDDSRYGDEVLRGLATAGPAALPTLVAQTAGPGWRAMPAFQAICAIGTPEARRAAGEAYMRLRDTAADDDLDACRNTLIALGGDEALQMLVDELGDERAPRRTRAARALGLLNDKRALPVLHAALEDPFSIEQVTEQAGDHITDDFLRDAMRRTREIYPVRDAARAAIERIG